METQARYHAGGFIINVEGDDGTEKPEYIQELANRLFWLGEHIRVVSLKKDFEEAKPALKKGAILLIEKYSSFFIPDEHPTPDITIYLKSEKDNMIPGTKANFTETIPKKGFTIEKNIKVTDHRPKVKSSIMQKIEAILNQG